MGLKLILLSGISARLGAGIETKWESEMIGLLVIRSPTCQSRKPSSWLRLLAFFYCTFERVLNLSFFLNFKPFPFLHVIFFLHGLPSFSPLKA